MERTDPVTEFAEFFGRSAATETRAHGRVNLIGEHTDYNGGFVLPAPIPQFTQVQLARRNDDLVRVVSLDYPGPIQAYRLGMETPRPPQVPDAWVNYVMGTTRHLLNVGYRIGGIDVRIQSSVPAGSGLSSSAALGVALLRGLRAAFALALDDLTIARVWQQIENEFIGARVGIMDPLSASLGESQYALFVDCRDLRCEKVALPAGAELVVIHSGVTHEHASGDYNTRRAECERACELLGVRELRDLAVADLAKLDRLPDPVRQRARHVITENQRVLEAVAAMRSGQARRLGQLFIESHASQRDDYQVSVPAVDQLISLGCEIPGVLGGRLTGGGFGGAVVFLVAAGAGRSVARQLVHRQASAAGHRPTVLVPAMDDSTP